MYLSRAELDPTRRETMVALISPQKFHGAVENAFPYQFSDGLTFSYPLWCNTIHQFRVWP